MNDDKLQQAHNLKRRIHRLESSLQEWEKQKESPFDGGEHDMRDLCVDGMNRRHWLDFRARAIEHLTLQLAEAKREYELL